jgi:hypothetical protein
MAWMDFAILRRFPMRFGGKGEGPFPLDHCLKGFFHYPHPILEE